MYTSVCKTAEVNGIAVVHGNRGVFHNSKQPAFKAVYKAMSEVCIMIRVLNNIIKVNMGNSLFLCPTIMIMPSLQSILPIL